LKNKETLLLIGAALIIGLLVGILLSKGKQGSPEPQMTSGQPPAVNYQQSIKMLEGLVATDPKNRGAWVELGNNYFDSSNPMKAIEAYDKALALDGNDPNVLTDQGVMFRQVGWYDRALANFTKANQLDPRHLQSLFNLGVVYRYDLNDFPKAKVAWQKYLEISPVGPAADKIRSEVEFIDSHPNLPAEAVKPRAAFPSAPQ